MAERTTVTKWFTRASHEAETKANHTHKQSATRHKGAGGRAKIFLSSHEPATAPRDKGLKNFSNGSHGKSMTCHSIKHMTCLRNTCPDFRFHLKTKNRFTLEIKLHTPTVKLRLISFGVKHGHHKHTSCIRETRIKKIILHMYWGQMKIPRIEYGRSTHTLTRRSLFSHKAWAPRVVFTLHTRAPSSPRNIASCHTSFLGTCRKRIGVSSRQQSTP